MLQIVNCWKNIVDQTEILKLNGLLSTDLIVRT